MAGVVDRLRRRLGPGPGDLEIDDLFNPVLDDEFEDIESYDEGTPDSIGSPQGGYSEVSENLLYGYEEASEQYFEPGQYPPMYPGQEEQEGEEGEEEPTEEEIKMARMALLQRSRERLSASEQFQQRAMEFNKGQK